MRLTGLVSPAPGQLKCWRDRGIPCRRGADTMCGVVDASCGRRHPASCDPGGKIERVRVIGIDAAEQGTCYAAQATAAARCSRVEDRGGLSTRRQYAGDARQVPAAPRLMCGCGRKDFGFRMIAHGHAKVYVTTTSPSSGSLPTAGPK